MTEKDWNELSGAVIAGLSLVTPVLCLLVLAGLVYLALR
jgi:hypothetical protein